MAKIDDFDLDEDAFGVLTPYARKVKLKIIEEVARLRRVRASYLALADKEHDDAQKAVYQELAENCRDAILTYMKDVGMFERGRWKAYTT